MVELLDLCGLESHKQFYSVSYSISKLTCAHGGSIIAPQCSTTNVREKSSAMVYRDLVKICIFKATDMLIRLYDNKWRL